MTSPRQTDDETVRVLAAAGIISTPAGRERAREKLADTDARMTPQRREAIRKRLRRYSDPS